MLQLFKRIQNDIAVQLEVFSFLHLSHPTRANLRDDFGGAEVRAGSDAHFFNTAVQLTTTVMGAGVACSGAVMMRNRWPSADTAYRFSSPVARV